MADEFKKQGLTLVGGGTETHLMVVDLTPFGVSLGTQVSFAMDVAGIYANRNTVPTEKGSPFYPSGLRVGTPLVTTRGMKENEMRQIARWIAQVVEHVKDEQLPKDPKERQAFLSDFRKKAVKDKFLLAIRKEVKELALKFPLFK